MSRQRVRRSLAVLSLSVLVSAVSLFATTLSASASSNSVFYLDLGASESVGVQPTAAAPLGHPTNDGYANDLVALEAARGVNLQLTELGCPGESTTTMISGADHCYQSPNSQLTQAIAFLQAHFNQPGLVTVDLGFNNLRPCIHQEFSDPNCVKTQLATLRTQLTSILQALVTAAGPQVTFVGLNHNDPYLANALNRTHDLNFATGSSVAIDALNATLSDVYGLFGIPVANVAKAFSNAVQTPTRFPHLGHVPTNEARACTWTWMCRRGPFGPNLHPNDVGYQVMANTIAAVMPVWS